MLNVMCHWHYAECHYAECHYAECHYAECHDAECHYVNVIMLNVIMQNVVALYIYFKVCTSIVCCCLLKKTKPSLSQSCTVIRKTCLKVHL